MSYVDFDPLELTIDSSLNHVVIGDFECPQVVGLRAEDVCSRDAFCALAKDCGLPGLRPTRLSDDLASATMSTDARTTRAAVTALVTFGRRLGALIATLRDHRTADEQANTPARHAYLSYWRTIDSIWLAGGLMSGRCGPIIMKGVHAGAAAAALPCRVELSPYPAVASLLGAARCAHGARVGGLIATADLGHTSIKTAIAELSIAGLNRLQVLDARGAPSQRSPDEVEDAVAKALVGVVNYATDASSRRVHLVVSVASYVASGVPVDDGESVYSSLANRVVSLHKRITAETDTDLLLDFVHDGTAAASIANSTNSATITVGTWLGVGFQPTEGPLLLDLSSKLMICS